MANDQVHMECKAWLIGKYMLPSLASFSPSHLRGSLGQTGGVETSLKLSDSGFACGTKRQSILRRITSSAGKMPYRLTDLAFVNDVYQDAEFRAVLVCIIRVETWKEFNYEILVFRLPQTEDAKRFQSVFRTLTFTSDHTEGRPVGNGNTMSPVPESHAQDRAYRSNGDRIDSGGPQNGGRNGGQDESHRIRENVVGNKLENEARSPGYRDEDRSHGLTTNHDENRNHSLSTNRDEDRNRGLTANRENDRSRGFPTNHSGPNQHPVPTPRKSVAAAQNQQYPSFNRSTLNNARRDDVTNGHVLYVRDVGTMATPPSAGVRGVNHGVWRRNEDPVVCELFCHRSKVFIFNSINMADVYCQATVAFEDDDVAAYQDNGAGPGTRSRPRPDPRDRPRRIGTEQRVKTSRLRARDKSSNLDSVAETEETDSRDDLTTDDRSSEEGDYRIEVLAPRQASPVKKMLVDTGTVRVTVEPPQEDDDDDDDDETGFGVQRAAVTHNANRFNAELEQQTEAVYAKPNKQINNATGDEVDSHMDRGSWSFQQFGASTDEEEQQRERSRKDDAVKFMVKPAQKSSGLERLFHKMSVRKNKSEASTKGNGMAAATIESSPGVPHARTVKIDPNSAQVLDDKVFSNDQVIRSPPPDMQRQPRDGRTTESNRHQSDTETQRFPVNFAVPLSPQRKGFTLGHQQRWVVERGDNFLVDYPENSNWDPVRPGSRAVQVVSPGVESQRKPGMGRDSRIENSRAQNMEMMTQRADPRRQNMNVGSQQQDLRSQQLDPKRQDRVETKISDSESRRHQAEFKSHAVEQRIQHPDVRMQNLDARFPDTGRASRMYASDAEAAYLRRAPAVTRKRENYEPTGSIDERESVGSKGYVSSRHKNYTSDQEDSRIHALPQSYDQRQVKLHIDNKPKSRSVLTLDKYMALRTGRDQRDQILASDAIKQIERKRTKLFGRDSILLPRGRAYTSERDLRSDTRSFEGGGDRGRMSDVISPTIVYPAEATRNPQRVARPSGYATEDDGLGVAPRGRLGSYSGVLDADRGIRGIRVEADRARRSKGSSSGYDSAEVVQGGGGGMGERGKTLGVGAGAQRRREADEGVVEDVRNVPQSRVNNINAARRRR